MKKIIVAIDGLKYSESAVTYAIHIAKQTSSHLVGIFLEDFTYHSYKTSQIIGGDPGVRETMIFFIYRN